MMVNNCINEYILNTILFVRLECFEQRDSVEYDELKTLYYMSSRELDFLMKKEGLTCFDMVKNERFKKEICAFHSATSFESHKEYIDSCFLNKCFE